MSHALLNQAGEDNRNVARLAARLAGLPTDVPGMTVNRLCGSGLSAVAVASALVRSGEADVVIAGGVESMTQAPWVTAKPAKAWAKPGASFDSALGWRFVNPRMVEQDGGRATISLGDTAEEVALLDGISRADCDEFAMRSHPNALRATKDGLFDAEIVPVDTARGTMTADESPRPDTSIEGLARLRPVFRSDGVVTAGNASPVPATEKLLARSGLSIGDFAAIELNEAFAAQSLACQRRLRMDPDVVNSDGGAIVLGHPLGASGTRLLVTLLGRLERLGGGRGLATMCIGVGQGVALAVESAS